MSGRRVALRHRVDIQVVILIVDNVLLAAAAAILVWVLVR